MFLISGVRVHRSQEGYVERVGQLDVIDIVGKS
jgi:hypothetical protein